MAKGAGDGALFYSHKSYLTQLTKMVLQKHPKIRAGA